MSQPETRFKERIQARLSLYDGALWFVKIQQVSIRGIPDMLLCVGGVFVAWELKVGSNKASPLQAYNLMGINRAGGVGRVVTPENEDESFQELDQLLEMVREEKDLHDRNERSPRVVRE